MDVPFKSMHFKICVKASKTMELINTHSREDYLYNIILLVCANMYVCSSVKPIYFYFTDIQGIFLLYIW